MAQFTAKKKSAPPSKGAKEKGKVTPTQAANDRHKAGAVLGENDSTYHNKC
jgi:hypothetical protein